MQKVQMLKFKWTTRIGQYHGHLGLNESDKISRKAGTAHWKGAKLLKLTHITWLQLICFGYKCIYIYIYIFYNSIIWQFNAIYIVHCTPDTVHSTQYTVHYTVCIIQYSLQFIVYSVHVTRWPDSLTMMPRHCLSFPWSDVLWAHRCVIQCIL